MVLNWNIEVIVDFIIAFGVLINTIVTYFMPKSQKITSLLYIRLSIFGMAVFMAMDGLSFLFVSELLARITGIVLFPTTIFMIIGINYTIREIFYSKGLIICFGLGMLFIYLAFQPRVAKSNLETGYVRMSWVGAFNILGIMFTAIMALYLFYWGLKTWLNAPVLIKKEASIFFLGIIVASPLAMIFYLFYLLEPVFILVSDFAIIIGIVIFLLAILREPKLLYILPFTVYRISVKDREGFPLFDHDWSKSNINDIIFTGFLNAVQLMSEEVMNIGGLLDINLEEGILVVRESKLITVGLVASKSSKLLSESVVKFANDFEKKFEKELKKSIKDMSQYEDAFELIEKYFSNFPYKIIKSKKQPLILTGKFARIPLEIENKLKSIFTDEQEYEFIKTELQRSPYYFSKQFLSLYDELKKEDQISEEEPKRLGKELTND
ncbi:MAG: hypothetical protein ACFFB0_19970 [Promethearchaeota archaeon]